MKKEVEIPKEKIEEILPHQGRMLLLDRVMIDGDKITGKLLVREEICEGHPVFDGKLALRGSDLFDMAAQLLGVWIASSPNLVSSHRNCLVRKYGGARFWKVIFAFELLTMEISTENIKVESFSREERQVTFISGEKFIVRVGEEKRAEIVAVELVAL